MSKLGDVGQGKGNEREQEKRDGLEMREPKLSHFITSGYIG